MKTANNHQGTKIVKISGCVFWRKPLWAGAEEYSFISVEREYATSAGYNVVCEHTFEVEIPETYDPISVEVQLIDAQIQKVTAEFSVRKADLEDQKAKLLSLPNFSHPED